MASFGVNPVSPEASKSWLLRKICPSSTGSKSTSHNHCAEVLAPGRRRRCLGQCGDAGNRLAQRKHREIRLPDEGLGQQLVVLAARHLGGAEGPEVVGDELGVEQAKAARLEPRDQMHQRYLGGIAGAMEHALAEEGAAEAH